MYRGPQTPRRPYPAYGVYRGPPRGAYGQPYAPYAAQPRPYQAFGPAQHPYLTLLGLQNKFQFDQVERILLQIAQRHPRRQLGGDLIEMKCNYADKSKDELAIPLNVNLPFNLKAATTCPVPTPVATKPYDKDKTRYFAKVMILSGAGPDDEKLKGKIHLSKKLNFLLARKEHGTVAPIGAEWSAEKDGATPNDASLKKTAIRAAKELIGVDLSACTHWLKFVEFTYTREEGRAVSVVFLPNVWDHFPEGFEPATQTREETKDVKEEIEEEEEDPEDPTKKKLVKKQVTTSKVVKVVEYRPFEMSLHAMLEYDCSRTLADDVVELCVFADCFNEMLQRDFGLQVIEILKQKKEETEEAEKKRKREEEEVAAAKKAKLENGEAEEKKEEVKEEKKEEKKPKMKLQHTVNQEVLVPFQYFDKQPHSGIITGSLRRDVLEGVFHQYGTMTKRDIDDLLLKGANLKPNTGAYNSPPSILYYIKIATTTTEVIVEETVEEKVEEKKEEKATENADAEADESKAEDTPMEEAEGGDEEGADGAMTETSLNKLLLKDLRTMCTEKGLSATGKKADLIERLLKGE